MFVLLITANRPSDVISLSTSRTFSTPTMLKGDSGMGSSDLATCCDGCGSGVLGKNVMERDQGSPSISLSFRFRPPKR